MLKEPPEFDIRLRKEKYPLRLLRIDDQFIVTGTTVSSFSGKLILARNKKSHEERTFMTPLKSIAVL